MANASQGLVDGGIRQMRGRNEMTKDEIEFEAELKLNLQGKWDREEEEYTIDEVRDPEIGEITYTVHGGLSDDDTRKLREELLSDFRSVSWIADISSALKKGDTERITQIAKKFAKT